MIELPIRDPCDLCLAAREEGWKVIEEGELTLTLINPRQFEIGQCCVITRRHVPTLLDLSDQECAAVLAAARRVAQALVQAYRPLGILTFQRGVQRTGDAALPFPCGAQAGRQRLGHRSAAAGDLRWRRSRARHSTRSWPGCRASGAGAGACRAACRNRRVIRANLPG